MRTPSIERLGIASSRSLLTMTPDPSTRMKAALTASVAAFMTLGAQAATLQERAGAESYPTKPIRFIVPYAPGGPTDILARIVGQKLTERWGQQVLVDNRGGANGLIAAELAARSPADGQTLFLGNTSILTINPSLYAKLPYDPEKDFAPVNLTVAAPLVLVVHPSTAVRSVSELVKLAKARPGQLTFASSGSAGVAHLSGELLKYLTNIDLTHVPYKGTAPAVTDLLSGQVSLTFSSAVSVMPHVKAGRLRGLGVTTPRRAPSLPELPAIAESVPGYDVSPWYGVLVPAGTPRAVVMKLHEEIARIVAASDVAKRLTVDGGSIVSAGPAEFGDTIRQERIKWANVVKAASIRLE
jgi:tripartite-type tricarboxylate transporter receptor subunit TctC